jgi:hypothetical protein
LARKSGDFGLAFHIAVVYSSPGEYVNAVAMPAYESAFNKGNYMRAAVIAKIGNLDRTYLWAATEKLYFSTLARMHELGPLFGYAHHEANALVTISRLDNTNPILRIHAREASKAYEDMYLDDAVKLLKAWNLEIPSTLSAKLAERERRAQERYDLERSLAADKEERDRLFAEQSAKQNPAAREK